jgi:hypothetical protein
MSNSMTADPYGPRQGGVSANRRRRRSSATAASLPLLLSLIVLCCAACGAPERGLDAGIAESAPKGTSRLWGERGELWSPTGRLPDFSYAGYHAGERPIPVVPVAVDVRDFGAVGDGVADDTQAFLDAIAAAERGAVFVPSGRYKITQVLFIEKSNIVLRGESRDSTVLFFPETLYDVVGPGKDGGPTGWSWGGGWIWSNPELERGDSDPPVWDEGVRLARVTTAARKGETSIAVSTTAGIEVGQYVRLVQYESDGSLSLRLHAGHQLNGRCIIDRPGEVVINWVLEVTRVEEGRIHFDRPFRIDVLPEWSAELWTAEPGVVEVGVEHLTVEFPVRKYPGHHNEPGQNAISLNRALNSWIRDVAILNSDNGIFLWYARYTTAEDIVIAGRGGHYGINIGGAQDTLVTRFRIENESVHDTSTSNVANGSVFSWGRGLAINFDHHRGGAFQNLYSAIHVGQPARMWRSSGTRSGHYTAAHETAWNIKPRAIPQKKQLWPAVNIIGRLNRAAAKHPGWLDSWIEPVVNLRPKDLHSAQLARRLKLPIPPPPGQPAALPEEVLARLPPLDSPLNPQGDQ